MATKTMKYGSIEFVPANEQREKPSIWARLKELGAEVTDYVSSVFMVPGLDVLQPKYRASLTTEELSRIDTVLLGIAQK